ncbi:hypothetical protein D0Y65_030952, partial [Glycine soja]
MTLRDIHAEVTWHWNMIATSISMDLNNEICSIFINDALPDTMIWDPSQSGTYYAIHGNLDVGSPITRTHQTLPMGNHKSLPTNAFRLHTHISTDSLCCRCGLHEENILHLLRDPPLGCHCFFYDSPYFSRQKTKEKPKETYKQQSHATYLQVSLYTSQQLCLFKESTLSPTQDHKILLT